MKKTPFVTKEQIEEIVKTYPTPFHLYDEAGIRKNAQAVKDAFSWNPGFREYFAVKATPNPYLLKILKEYDMGCDCSSYTELMLAKSCGFDGKHIMFSSNDTPAEEFAYADKLGAIINLDDFTHIDFLEKTIGYIPETISCRFNPGGVFKLSNGIMDNPGDSKYGMTKDQLFEAFKILKSKGAKYFGIHAFLASNTVTNEYYPQLAKQLFELVVELKNETGCDIRFVNLSGGVGVAYKPDQTPNDIKVIGEGVHKVYDEVLVPAGMGDVSIYTEMGRFMLAPYGCVVTKAIQEQMKKDGTDHVWLSLEKIPKEIILSHFPNIYQHCLEEGYDATKEWIPVVPAQHYFMGGIWVDSDSHTSMPNLYAVGETSCNGVHGKNRLASNSLLESLVFAKRAARKIMSEKQMNKATA